ncbi:MAG: hypothetical protein GEV07_01015 [Streptosporangiales bacterium]|nr:hypothetical protein [Streptosporangiales bacterium]
MQLGGDRKAVSSAQRAAFGATGKGLPNRYRRRPNRKCRGCWPARTPTTSLSPDRRRDPARSLHEVSHEATYLWSLLAVTVGCGGGDGGTGGTGGTSGSSTFVYGASSDPVTLDGAYVSDGESLRPIRQIFETLVVTKPGRTDIEPLLAKKYSPVKGGKSWKFELHADVKFTDGTPLNAKAVCANFERWFNFKNLAQQTAAYYFARCSARSPTRGPTASTSRARRRARTSRSST